MYVYVYRYGKGRRRRKRKRKRCGYVKIQIIGISNENIERLEVLPIKY